MSKNSPALSQPAYDYILEMIMSKQLKPGERIPEDKIAKIFGISRTPVRDAMRLLANEGLITIYPNRFAQVTEYSIDTIREICVLRVAMDTIAIKLSLLFGSKADFYRLREIAVKCNEAFYSNDFQKCIQYDCDFHLELNNISRNSLLIKFQKEINLRIRFILLYSPTPMPNEAVTSQHIQLSNALLNQDEKLALRIAVNHLTTFYNLEEIYPENFFDYLKKDEQDKEIIE